MEIGLSNIDYCQQSIHISSFFEFTFFFPTELKHTVHTY